jgi:alkylhydroperoxidase family enzyme
METQEQEYPMTWMGPQATRQAVIGTLPAVAEKFDRLYASFWQQPHIPAPTLELCRLRLAQLHRSKSDWTRQEQEIPAAKREKLSDWNHSAEFTDAERACLEFTEMYAMDAQSITDEQAAAVKRHHGDAGLVALVEALGVFDGMTRLSLLWQLPIGDGRQ